jgi:methionyl-tRNA formyltransferase
MTERIRPTDTAGDLLGRLAEGGAGLLVATLDGIEDGSLEAREQPAEGVSYAPKITGRDARVDWTEPGRAIDRRIRACTPAPGAWTTYDGERIKLGPVTPVPTGALAPGQLRSPRTPSGRHRHRRRAARRGQGLRQEADAAADWARGVRLRRPVTEAVSFGD